MQRPKHVFETYIRATPEAVWAALTDPALTKRYYHETAVESDWEAGSTVGYRMHDGRIAVEGEIVEVDPPRRLVTTFTLSHAPEASAEAPSRVTWEIEPQADGVCKVTLVHDDFHGEATYAMVAQGWPPILAGLKTLLETGEGLFAAS